MSETKMSEIIKASLEGIKEFADVDTVFGNAITTPTGITIIPVSKVTLGFAGGGVDIPVKKLLPPQSFGGGSGTGVSITPVAFLVAKPDGTVNLISLMPQQNGGMGIEKLFELIENAPEIIEKIKEAIQD